MQINDYIPKGERLTPQNRLIIAENASELWSDVFFRISNADPTLITDDDASEVAEQCEAAFLAYIVPKLTVSL